MFKVPRGSDQGPETWEAPAAPAAPAAAPKAKSVMHNARWDFVFWCAFN